MMEVAMMEVRIRRLSLALESDRPPRWLGPSRLEQLQDFVAWDKYMLSYLKCRDRHVKLRQQLDELRRELANKKLARTRDLLRQAAEVTVEPLRSALLHIAEEGTDDQLINDPVIRKIGG
jgi:hypothetical protein